MVNQTVFYLAMALAGFERVARHARASPGPPAKYNAKLLRCHIVVGFIPMFLYKVQYIFWQIMLHENQAHHLRRVCILASSR